MVNFDVAYRKSSASYRTQPHLLEGALQKSSSSWLSGELCVTEIALNMIRKEKTLSKDALTNIIKKIARRVNAITCVGDYSAILTRHCTMMLNAACYQLFELCRSEFCFKDKKCYYNEH